MTNRKPLLTCIALILLLSIVAFGVVACSNNNYNIALTQTYLELNVGEEVRLTAEITRYAGKNKPVWTSTRAEIATVSDDGVVTAISAGAATIKVTLEDKSTCCTVLVKEVEPEIVDVTSITLDINVISDLFIGDKTQLSASVAPSNATDKTVTWQSMDTSIATVNSSGLVTVVGCGVTIITATAGDKLAVCQVNVRNPAISFLDIRSVTLDRDSLELSPNQTATLVATVTPSDATDKTVTWQSMDTSVATVNGSGLVTAVANGVTVIIAKIGNSLDACMVTVKQSALNVDNEFKFKTMKVSDGNSVNGWVSPATDTFSFADEIVAGRDVSYTVCRDLECTDVIPSKTVSLNTGDNVFYVLANFSDNSSKLYKATVRRLALCTITFDSNGGTAVAPITADEGTVINFSTPLKVGYDFAGWQLDDKVYLATYTVKGNVTFTAQFNAKKYTASFDKNNADTPQYGVSVKVAYDSDYKFFVPTRQGYVFDGWYIGDVQYTDGDGNSLAPWKFTEDKTFVAHWAEPYTLTAQVQGCDGAVAKVDKNRLVGGESAHVFVTDINLGYQFDGWYLDDELLSNEIPYTFTMPEKDVTLTAKIKLENDASNLVFTSTQTEFKINGVRDATVTELTIPEYTTKINVDAFKECKSLKTVNWLATSCGTNDAYHMFLGLSLNDVNVGSKVQRFPGSAFYYCEIENVNYDGDLESWCAIYFFNQYSNPLFFAEKFYLQGEKVVDIDLPRDMQISKYAFGRVKLGKVNYLGSVEDWLAKKFTSNTNPAANAESFYFNGEELQHLVIPETVTDIGGHAFEGMKSLTQVTLHGNVKSIGSEAFSSCDNLSRVDVPSLQAWLDIDFGGFSSYLSYLSNPLYYAHDLYIDGEKATEVVVPEGTTEIKQGAFAGSSITSVQLPSSVKTIEDYAFYWSELTACDLSNVTSIGKWSFSRSELTGALVLSEVTSIGERAFNGCKNITAVTTGSSLTNIGVGAFCASGIESVTIAEGLTELESTAFSSCSNLTSVQLPASLVSIGSLAFINCDKLTKVVLYDNVTSIGERAFARQTPVEIYYNGTQSQWAQIAVEQPDTAFTNNTIYFYSEAEPALNDEETAYDGFFWHYVEGQAEAWNYNCTTVKVIKISDGVETGVERLRFTVNEQITLTAEVCLGQQFAGWYDGEQLLSDQTTYQFTTSEFVVEIVAKWQTEEVVSNYTFNATTTEFVITGLKDTSVTEITVPAYVTAFAIDNVNSTYFNSLSKVNYLGDLDGWCTINFLTTTNNPLFGAHYLYINDELVADLVIPESVSVVYRYAFAGGYFDSVTFGSHVTKIGASAFYKVQCQNFYYTSTLADWCSTEFYSEVQLLNKCENVYFDGELLSGELVIPSGIETIGAYAFADCDKITSVVIPSTVDLIDAYAFAYASLQSVDVAASEIGNYAFHYCDKLTTLDIAQQVVTIGRSAFAYCNDLTSVVIPSTVKTIGVLAFGYCGLQSVDVAANEIGNSAFALCESLFNLTLREGITSIGSLAFRKCPLNDEVVIPNSVTVLGSSVFDTCESLKKLVIGNGVVKLPSLFVRECDNLTDVVITSRITELRGSMFQLCDSIQSLYYLGTLDQWCGMTVRSLTSLHCTWFSKLYCNGELIEGQVNIPQGRTEVKENLFFNLQDVTSVVIPNGVTSIDSYAFGRSGITSIVVPTSVTKIAVSAFYECESPVTVYYQGTAEQWSQIGYTVNDVAVYFYSAMEPALNDEETAYDGNYWRYVEGQIAVWKITSRALTQQTVADGKVVKSNVTVYDIGEQVTLTAKYNLGYDFVGWYNGDELLSDDASYQLTMPERNLTLTAKYQIDSRVANLWFTSTETEFKIRGVKDSSVDIVIPEYTTEIASTAFGNELTKVTWLPSTVGSADDVFDYCNIGAFVIDQAVTELPADLFKTCKSIGSVIYNGNIESWLSIEFANVYSNPLRIATEFVVDGEPVTELVVPSAVTAIGDYAFYGAGFLTSVTFECAQEINLDESSGLKSLGNFAFYGCNHLTECVLPQGLEFIGKYAFSYSALGGDLVIPDSVTEMGERAFEHTNIVSVTILEGVNIIPSYAFYHCNELVNATISDGVTEIGQRAFYYCQGLETVVIPSSIESIGAYAFFNCVKLADLTISEGVQNIANSAFVSCKALESVVIPSSVKVIGKNAFRLCTLLTNVTISDGVREIDDGAFMSTELTSVVLPSSIEKLGSLALGNNKLDEVYYKGQAEQWEQLDASKSGVLNATVYFCSEVEPALNDEGTAYDGNYWHYVDGEIVVWTKDDNE